MEKLPDLAPPPPPCRMTRAQYLDWLETSDWLRGPVDAVSAVVLVGFIVLSWVGAAALWWAVWRILAFVAGQVADLPFWYILAALIL